MGCIASIRQHAAPDTHVVLVDNASPDPSGAELARRYQEVEGITVIRTRHNRGFGAGCNAGIQHALSTLTDLEHVLLLNPDARLRPGALGALRSCARHHPRAAIVGCRIVDRRGELWFANGRLPRWTLSEPHVPPPGNKTEHPSEFVSGCCMLIDAAMLRRGVRFDESFFLYGEDADLCYRVLQRGRSIWITQAATVEHRGGGSQPGRPVLGELSAGRVYWMTRAKMRLASKHFGYARRLCLLANALVVKPAQTLFGSRGLRWVGPYYRGLAAGLFGR